ncbi:hypothetical protein M2337_002465 [Sphingobium sp. B2D3A]|nr:hypothetical protein [Sphingobium sp. B2D3A]
MLDGALSEIDRGTAELSATLPLGLYLVEWSSAGQQTQSMVRLDGKEQSVQVHFDPSGDNASASSTPATADRLALLDAVNGSIRPSERAYESSIVLIVSADADAKDYVLDLELRLYDREDVAMRANRDDAPNLELGTGERALCYRVRPGRYHIGYRSIGGEQLGQSVPALAGRQTLVFLTVSRTKLISAEGDEFHEEESAGIDPSRTTIVTVRGDEKDYRVRERVRLAGLMLFDLTNATNSLTNDVVEVLDDPKTDPLLRLYGALVAVSAFERASALPVSDDRRDTALIRLDEAWMARLRKWIADPAQPGLPTDALAAIWRAQRVGSDTFDVRAWSKLPSRIEAPPMLECSWRWAIEESITRPDAVRGTAVMAATARSSGGNLPWLCWEIAAAKARFVPANARADDLAALVLQVADKVAALVEPDALSRTLANGLDALSPDLKATALRAMQLVAPETKEVSVEAISDLAVALGLPSRLLQKRLVRTSAALDTAGIALASTKEDASGREVSKAPVVEAPGLSRRIQFPKDLQKGRFGGKAAKRGFTVTATFEETTSKNWLKVHFVVEGPGRDGDEVQFHRHDSFRPQMVKKKLRSKVARMTVTVWGGFTLGVWIPAHGIELELDLAEMRGAPHIIRER